jgi:hypothetical protein
MANYPKIQVDDEISFLDLIIMLLRYRKYIIGVTVFFIVLIVVGYFTYPAYQYGRAMEKKQIQGKMNVQIAPRAQSYMYNDLENYFNRADIILDSMRAAGMDTFKYKKEQEVSLADETQRLSALYIIDLYLVRNLSLTGEVYAKKEEDRTFFIKNLKKNEETVTSVIFRNKNPELVKNFLASIFAIGSAGLGDMLRPTAENVVNNYERLMNLSNSSEAMKMFLEKDFDDYIFLKSFLDGKENVLVQIGEPILTEPVILLNVLKRSYLIRGVIIVFAGFLFSVFFVFVLNSIRNIKNNAEVMARIKDAMGKSADQ